MLSCAGYLKPERAVTPVLRSVDADREAVRLRGMGHNEHRIGIKIARSIALAGNHASWLGVLTELTQRGHQNAELWFADLDVR
jgi:hypothetical protein